MNQIQAESQRPVCRLRLSREPFGIAGSHLGGTPYVPRDGQIPTDNDGNQLWLCAQINFAQMPPLEGFPREGILQFFLSDFDLDGGFGIYESEDGVTQNSWRARFYPTVDDTVTEAECRAKMTVPWEEASRKNMPRPAHSYDLKDIEAGRLALWRCPNVPLKITFQPAEREGVNHEDCRFGILFAAALKTRLPGADPEAFRPCELDGRTPEEREALDKIRRQIERGGCKTGGYPRYCQDDPRLYSEEQGLEEMDIGLNGGTLNFVIRAEDLRNRDFSRVLAQWACT